MRFAVIGLLVFLSMLTVAEAACRNPLVSAPPLWPPFVIQQADGSRAGHAFDMARTILEPDFGTIRIDIVKPWSRVQRDLREGKIDFILAAIYSKERAKTMLFAQAWLEDIYAVVQSTANLFPFKGVDSLSGRNGGYLQGVRIPAPYSTLLKPDRALKPIPNVPSLYRMLKANRLDYLIVSRESFWSVMPEDFSAADFDIVAGSEIAVPVHLVVSKKSPCADHIDQINQRIDAYIPHR